MLTVHPAPEVLFDLRVVEAALLLGLLCASPLLKGPTPPGAAASNGHSAIVTVVRAVKVPRRQLILSLLNLAAFTAFLDGTVTVANAIFKHVAETKLAPWRGIEYYSVALLVAFAGLAIVGSFKDARGTSIWQSKVVKLFVLVALGFDIALAVLIPLVVPIWKVYPNPEPHVPEDPQPIPPVGLAPAVHFGLTVLRALILLVLFPALFFPRTAYEAAQTESAPPAGETSLLIPSAAAASAATSAGLAAPKAKYGTFNPAPSTAPPSRAHTPAPSIGGPSTSANDKPARAETLTWAETGTRLKRLLPYLWPSNSIGLQVLAVLCLLIVATGRAVNAYLPFKLSEVIDVLGEEDASTKVWNPLFWYVGLKFLQGSGGLAAFRDVLWAPVMQYSDRSMSQLCFDHILNLSLAWHTRRKTGEVLRILDRGAAINHIFELLLFNVIPTLADISIALYIFFWYFGPILSIVIATVMFTYIALSITLTTWRTKLRRQMNDSDVVTRGIHTDCLLNYETVKYFGGEQHEGERYRSAIAKYQGFEYKVMASLNLLNLTQNFVISVGLLVGSLIVCLSPAHSPDQAVKRFVVFITYLAQLYAPLNSLGYIYRSINQNLVDTERLVELLDEPTEVQDKPDAKELVVTDGVIEFDNVTFSYDNRTTALNGVSFTVPKGGSVALVGESGSGKSTILRLLYRFYDLAPSNGAIRIDGQDIRDVTQASLRKAIGVVPQDSVLFNNTIAYNVGYGKFGASTEEIENAARAAQMHERIMSFPDGYETKVGERGVRLSGGEKQRVAIARTILKAPRIILLDEATSALDTTTERDIQKALQNLVDGRSSLSIAHRLSTIVNSDVILVLNGGEIVESGSHRELVDRDGRFAAMWADQVSSADETRTLPDTNKDEAGEVPGYEVDAPEEDNQEAHILPIPAVDTPDNLSFNHAGAAPFGLGPQLVPAEQLVAAGVPSENPVPIQPEQQTASERSLHEVRPDVSFAAAAAGETKDEGAKAEETTPEADNAATEAEAAKPEEAAVKADDVATPQPEEAPAAAAAAAPLAFPASDSTRDLTTSPAAFPKSDDASSLAGSARPALRETTSGGSSIPGTPGTTGVTFAPGTEGERFRQAAQRIRKISQGAAAKGGQRFAQLARRMSQGPSRQASISSTGRVVSPPSSPGLNRLSREGSDSVRASMDAEGADSGSVADSDKKKKDKKDKKDKQKSSN